jgi:uncharacterized membrane protein YgcG
MTFKRILYTLAALAMIAIGTLVFYAVIQDEPNARGSGGGEEKYMFLDEVVIGMSVDEQGELAVSERISYDLGTRAWRGLYQDIILANDEQVESVSVYRVTGGFKQRLDPGSGIVLGVGGAYGSYGYGVVNDPTRRLRIVWNVADTGSKEYLVKYRLSGAVENHRDASSLLWDVWGTGWETGVGRLRAAVKFPGELKSVHVRTDGLQSHVSGPEMDGRRAAFAVRDLPSQEAVQIQVAAEPLSGMPQEDSDIVASIEAENARIDAFNADRAQRSEELLDRPLWWFFIWSLAGALLGLLAVYVAYLLMGRDRTKPVSAGGSYQYPPEKIPAPVIAKAIGGSSVEERVSATLLSMLQRDIFRVMPSVKRKEDIGIMNNVGQQTFDATKLAPWELPIAELLQTAIDAHPERAPDFTELKDHLTPSAAETKVAAFERAIDGEMPKHGLTRAYRGRLRRTMFVIAGMALYALALIAAMGSTSENDAAHRWDAAWFALPLIGFSSVIVWAAIEGNAFYRLKADQEQRLRAWETYQDFFRNMDLSREYPLTVEIWDEALIYAAAFGFATKVITNMPRTAADGALDRGDTGLGMISHHAFAATAIGSVTSGISSVTGMSTSSSSGGGGFSGGSSGGGGGGGW